MKLKKIYDSLDDTLKHLKFQVIESIPFAEQVCPQFDDPEDLFYWLKGKVKYKNDPKGTELLQTMQTMFRGRYWGVPGWGDCDCFVITTLACMIVQGWDGISIALVGRKRSVPVHIYVTIDWDGERKVFDLTNRKYDHERDTYKYIQEIPVPWRNWKSIKVQQLNENSMYLQLAESAEAEEQNPYIYVPDITGRTRGIRVREDLFDDLDDVEYYRLMRELAPFQQKVQQGLSESAYLADRASRRAKRAQKQADQEEKRKQKNEKRKAKNEIKKAKAEAKKSGRGASILDSVTQAIGGVIGGKVGGGAELPDDDGGEPPPPPEEKSNTGLYIGLAAGGLGLAALVAYLMNRNKAS